VKPHVQRVRAAPDGALLTVHSMHAALAPAALALARELAERRATEAGPRALPGWGAVWLKAAPLSPSGARRHGRARWLGRPAPRLRELAHLAWLEARLFRVARPCFAAAAYAGGRLVHQLLATEEVPGALPFGAAPAHWSDPELARELGAELGRMHALGFLHGDVYPRNVLVTPPEFAGAPGASGASGASGAAEPSAAGAPPTGRRLVWVDCWAGGPGHGDRSWPRPLARDLGTWFASAAERWDSALTAAFWGAYGAARAANGRPVRAGQALLRSAVRERRSELRRIEREPRRAGPAGPPRAGWEPAAALAALLTAAASGD